jgi:hypothetical protein
MILALSLSIAVCVPGAVARTPLETVDAFTAAYNARDLTAVEAVVAPAARVSDGARVLSGTELIANYRTRVFTVEPAYVSRTLQQLTAGDMVAQTEALTGGAAGAFTGLTVYRVERGCIVEMSVNR